MGIWAGEPARPLLLPYLKGVRLGHLDHATTAFSPLLGRALRTVASNIRLGLLGFTLFAFRL